MGGKFCFVFLGILFCFSVVFAQTQSHPASEITNGTFGSGTFTFPSTLKIGSGVTVSNVSAILMLNDTLSGAPMIQFARTDVAITYKIDMLNSNLNFRRTDSAVDILTMDTIGRVGIGTTSPTARLHVVGGTNDFTPNVVGIQAGFDGSNYALEITNSGGTPYIDFQNDSSGTDYDMRLILTGDDTLAVEGGSVGIGTASPLTNFHVAGSAYVSASLYTTSVDADWTSDSNSLTLSSGGTGTILFKTNGPSGTEHMRIASTGNVGIGTASPLVKLQVEGGVAGNNLAGVNLLEDSTDFSNTASWGSLTLVQTTFVDGSEIKVLESTSTSDGGTCYEWAYYQKRVRVYPNKKYEFSVWARQTVGTSGSKYLGFYVYDSAGTQITGNWSNPYFWIGSTGSPGSAWRRINGYLEPSYVTDNPVDGQPDNQSAKTVGSDWRMPSNAAYAIIRFGYCYSGVVGDKMQFAFPEIREVTVEDNDFGTIYVDSLNQRVGIGTASPQAPLEVIGAANTIVLRQTSSTSYAGLRIYNDQNSNVRSLELDYSGSAYASALLTGSPTGEQGAITTTGAFPLVLGTSNTARITILSGGNVGIGTNNPGTKLHVASGWIAADNNYGLALTDSGGLARVGLKITTGDDYQIGDAAKPNDIIFYAGTAERMRITSAGVLAYNELAARGSNITLPSGKPKSPILGSLGGLWTELADYSSQISENDLGNVTMRVTRSAWDTAAATSNTWTRRAGLTFEALVETSNWAGGADHMMIGWHDSAAGVNYIDLVYAVYFDNGVLRVYEDGNLRISGASYTLGDKIWIKVILKSAGALYYVKYNGQNYWSLVYDSGYSSEDNLRPGFSVYAGDFDVRYAQVYDNENVIVSVGDSYFNGNVGIGTTSPVEKLDVVGDAYFHKGGAVGGFTLNGNDLWSSRLYTNAYFNGANEVYRTSDRGAFKMLFQHDGDGSPQYIAMYGANQGTAGNTITWNTVGFVMDEDGQVGIGTTSPLAKFHINQAAAGWDDGIRLTQGASYSNILQDGNILRFRNVAANGYEFWNGAGSSSLVAVRDGGNVGIGTTSPSGKLEVVAPAIIGADTTLYNSYSSLHVASTDNVHLTLEDISQNTAAIAADGSGIYVATEQGDIMFRTGATYNGDFTATGTERMKIANTGRVGINTTSPQATLDVKGSLAYTDGTNYVAFESPLGWTYSENCTEFNHMIRAINGMVAHDVYYTSASSSAWCTAKLSKTIFLPAGTFYASAVLSDTRAGSTAGYWFARLLWDGILMQEVDIGSDSSQFTNLYGSVSHTTAGDVVIELWLTSKVGVGSYSIDAYWGPVTVSLIMAT